MDSRTRQKALLSLTATGLLSWTILPLAIPPFGAYTLAQAMEVSLFQVIGAIGWPLAILGVIASTLMGSSLGSLASVFGILIYPAVLLLGLRVFAARRRMPWELPLLHVLLVVSFALVWYAVRNGYNFMVG
jgi:hypothetical protein